MLGKFMEERAGLEACLWVRPAYIRPVSLLGGLAPLAMVGLVLAMLPGRFVAVCAAVTEPNWISGKPPYLQKTLHGTKNTLIADWSQPPSSVADESSRMIPANAIRQSGFAAGVYLDKIWYYCIDKGRYYYLDNRQYELLGGLSYMLGRCNYPLLNGRGPAWWGVDSRTTAEFTQQMGADRMDSGELLAVLYDPLYLGARWSPLIYGFCLGYTGSLGQQWCPVRPGGANLVGYFDTIWQHYLDRGQYYYLDKRQYNLLGGSAYLLGHPSYPLWYSYNFYAWPAVKVTPHEVKIQAEWVDFYGMVTILGEPAQAGDEVFASVSGSGQIEVGQFAVVIPGWYGYMRVFRDNPLTVDKDGALPNDVLNFTVRQKRSGMLFPADAVSGAAIWTTHGSQIRVDLFAIPEPSTVLTLGAGLLILSRRHFGDSHH